LHFLLIPNKFKIFFDGLAIDDCDQPFPPILIVKKVSFSSATIEWKVDERQVEFQKNDTKRILEFVLEHVKIPKDKYKIIKGGKKEKEKGKKKKI